MPHDDVTTHPATVHNQSVLQHSLASVNQWLIVSDLVRVATPRLARLSN